MAEQTPLTLTVVSDIHYYSKKTGTSGKAYEAANAKSQKLLAECPEVLEAAFRQIAKDDRSDIVLVSGDTTNNGEVESHRPAEYAEGGRQTRLCDHRDARLSGFRRDGRLCGRRKGQGARLA